MVNKASVLLCVAGSSTPSKVPSVGANTYKDYEIACKVAGAITLKSFSAGAVLLSLYSLA